METFSADNLTSLITSGLTLLSGITSFLIPILGNRKGLEKTRRALELYQARAECMQGLVNSKALSDKELEREELLARQMLADTACAIEKSCTPIIDRVSRFCGIALAVLFFVSGFFMLMCVAVCMLALEASQRSGMIYFTGALNTIIALCFLFNAVRFFNTVTQSDTNSVQIDNQRTFRIVTWNPFEQRILRIGYLVLPLVLALVSFALVVAYLEILAMFPDASTQTAVALAIMQKSVYGILAFAVVFAIACILYALIDRKKCDKEFRKRAKGYSLSFEDANLLLDWQDAKSDTRLEFSYTLRTAQNKPWFNCLYGEILMQGQTQGNSTSLERNGLVYWVVGNDKRAIRKRRLV